MLGNITEKQPSKKVAPISVGSSGGFPPVMRSTAAKRLKTHDVEDSKVSVEAVGKAQHPARAASRSAAYTATSGPVDESSEINKSMVEAMSPSEISMALDEIRSLLSPKSIEFLQRAPAPSEVAEVTAAKQPFSKKASSTVDLAQNVPLVPTENPWLNDNILREAVAQTASPDVRSESPTTDRYDLNGRKVVDPEVAGTKIREEVHKSGLFSSNKSLADEVGVMVASQCVEHLLPVAKGVGREEAVFLWRRDALTSAQHQPQDELKHHQFQSDSPGYTLREIIEMFRSEFAAQRIVAMRMLSGILLRRECAVSLEAYSRAFALNTDQSELGCIEDEVGRGSLIFANLSACFEALVASVTSALSTSASGTDLVLASSTSAPASAAVSCEHSQQLRKLLCWSCMHLLCAPDLPVELPMLLLWALGSNIGMASPGDAGVGAGDVQLAPSFGLNAPRNNPAVAKLGLLRCLHMYLRSPAEEASVDWLRCRSTLWAAYGTPRLSTPHTRRSGGSAYEQDMAECLERSSKFLADEGEDEEGGDEQQDEQKPRTPDSVAEAFALQCRWSRVSAIVSRSAVVASLANHAITAVENLAVAAAGSASSSSGDIVTALGISSLRLLALITRQGGDDILPVLQRQFLRPSWRFFVTMCESGHAGTDSALGEICRRWWDVLAELVLRDRTAAAFLFETHGEWVGTIVLRLLLRKPRAHAAANSEDGSSAETIDNVVGRVVQSCLVYGFGFECVTELLMADQVSSAAEALSSGPRFSVRLLLMLEQAAVSAGAALGAYVSGLVATSQVPFALPKAVSEAIQASSSIFSFIKRNWIELQRLVLERSLPAPVEGSTAALALLGAVFVRAQDDELAATSELPGDMASECRVKMAASIVASGGLRGRGLIFAAIRFNAYLLAEEQQKVGGSVTAAVLHLSGQGRELARFAASQDLFDLVLVSQCITDYAASSSSKYDPVQGSTSWLQAQEHALALYRHLNVAAEMGRGGGLSHGEALQAYVRSASWCCQMLRILPPPLASEDDLSVSAEEQLIRGSVAEGILMWHGQRLQQAGILVQITGIASFLVRYPGNESVARSLDSILGAHLPKMTANSHCAFLVDFTRIYLRRLIFACHSREDGNLSEQYGELEANYGAFADAIGNRAFRCDVSFVPVGEGSAVSGTAPYSRAGEWMTLRGPGNTPIVLKASWAFEVLMGDLAGENLADWLEVLLAQHRNQSRGGGDDESLLASQIYTLLKLSTSDQAAKWTNASQAELAGGALGEVNERAVVAYRLLLTQLLQGIERHASSFTAAFCRVVSKEYFATTGVMSSHRHKMRAARNGSSSKYVSLEGVLDLCEKALDAGLNQAVDERVHSIVLIAISGPLMPWSVRQRVWTQLSALRLVHLLEDGGILLALLPLLLLPPPSAEGPQGAAVVRGPMATESLSLYLEIVDAICNLRSAADRSWTIVAVSVVQLSHFIFCETSVAHGHRATSDVISGQRAELLLRILSLGEEKGSDATWLCKALLAHAAATCTNSCNGHSSPSEDVLGQVCTTCGEDADTELAGIVALPHGILVDKGDGTREELRELVHM